MKGVLIILAVVVALVIVSGKLMSAYNQLSTERHDIQARWAQLENDMRQQEQLAATIGTRPTSDTREQAVASDMKEARLELLQARDKQNQMAADNRLSAVLARFLALRPEDDLADIQNRIAEDRNDYNEALQKYNTDLKLFPKNVAAALFHFEADDAYFRAESDKTATQ